MAATSSKELVAATSSKGLVAATSSKGLVAATSNKGLVAATSNKGLVAATWATNWTWVPDYGFMGKIKYRESTARVPEGTAGLETRNGFSRQFSITFKKDS